MRLHRTHLAGLAAIAGVGLLAVHPLAASPVIGTVLWARSLTGAAAFLVGAAILWPHLTPLLVCGGLLALYARHTYPPGAITDTIRARFLTWWYLLAHLHPLGHGARSTRLACEAASLRSGGLAMDGGPARNEPLQLLYEYGLFAAAAMATGLWLLWPHLALGTAVTAILGAALVVVSTSSPLRAFGRWLRKGREGPLWGPPLKASLTIHIDHEGAAHFFGTADIAGDRARQVEICRALFEAGWLWMAQYQLTGEEIDAARPT